MKRERVSRAWFVAGVAGAVVGAPASAWACGCFAPPNPATPVVQAGEQVVFAMDGGQVTMHVRVQYGGPAEEFGWLLPLPSVPDLEVGTEELFYALEQSTRPTFFTNYLYGEACNYVGVDAGASFDSSVGVPNEGGAPPNVLVSREAVGPYDTAVLRADDRAAMLAWLEENRFYVPGPLADAVGPYIRPGSYFLALKLLSDRDAGDLAPLVLRYDAELPMIPMTLTQVGAEPDMPVTVYVLGEHRAIPRNYRHVILNEEHIDWFAGGYNYAEVVTRAVDEADGHHAFVTEFAGATDRMRGQLAGPSRFGDRAELEATTEAGAYVTALRNRGFLWTSTLVGILAETFAMPQAVRDAGFAEDIYYANLDWFLTTYREQNPEQFEGEAFEFDPAAITARLWAVVVEPARGAEQLFLDHPKLTRLFTTLSPEEMIKDPVFSFNPSLADVSNVHQATFTVPCEGDQRAAHGELALPDGRLYTTNAVEWSNRTATTPYTQRIEVLREEGMPEVEVDNTAVINAGAKTANGGAVITDGRGRGCACATPSDAAPWGLAAGLLLLPLALRRRRRA